MTKLVGSILGHSVSKFRRAPDNSLVLPDCLLGVEFEFENVRATAQTEAAAFLGLWAQKDDGSLRNAGKEFVFKEPLFGVDATTAIGQLVELAIKHKFVCNVRTGLHVHVDCRDMTTDALRGMCLAYAIAEPFIYQWAGDNREESNFCVPWYYSEESVVAASKIIKALTSEEKIESRNDTSKMATTGYQRYAGFNMNSLDRFGSVEFRHLQTCVNLKRIMGWVNMILHLKKVGMSFKSKDLYQQLVKGNASTVLQYTVGPLADEIAQVCSGQTKELLDTGRETMTNLYGLTMDLDSPYSKFSKNLSKFKGVNKGLQKFKARKTPNEAAPVQPRSGAIDEMYFAPRPEATIRMAGEAFQTQDWRVDWLNQINRIRPVDDLAVPLEAAPARRLPANRR